MLSYLNPLSYRYYPTMGGKLPIHVRNILVPLLVFGEQLKSGWKMYTLVHTVRLRCGGKGVRGQS